MLLQGVQLDCLISLGNVFSHQREKDLTKRVIFSRKCFTLLQGRRVGPLKTCVRELARTTGDIYAKQTGTNPAAIYIHCFPMDQSLIHTDKYRENHRGKDGFFDHTKALQEKREFHTHHNPRSDRRVAPATRQT